MKKTIVSIACLLIPIFSYGEVCTRFNPNPIKSVLKDSKMIHFNLNDVARDQVYCFYSMSDGPRCDLSYGGKSYSFVFEREFNEQQVASGKLKEFFENWLQDAAGEPVMLNTYNTLFEFDNDYEDINCTNWTEKLTYTLKINNKESIVLY